LGSKLIYTANIGNYDNLQINTCEGWKNAAIDMPYGFDDYTQVKSARLYKIMPYFWHEHDISLWVDSNIKMSNGFDADEALEWMGDADMLMVEHGRDCIYDEARACIERKKDSPKVIMKQIKHYESEGYPTNEGLFATGFMMRRHNDRVHELMMEWWNQVAEYSHRDQLSFNYALWKTGNKVKVAEIPYKYTYEEGRLRLHRHIKK